jgi:hypothetical protein
MIENADKMYDELQKLVSSLRDVRSQESLGAHLNAPEMADQAKTKITELETKIREAEPAWQKSLATLRARSGKFPDDETLSAYVAFANQRDTMTKLEMEAADITDPDQATALDERINEQNEKLRETRAKWQAVAKAKE